MFALDRCNLDPVILGCNRHQVRCFMKALNLKNSCMLAVKPVMYGTIELHKNKDHSENNV